MSSKAKRDEAKHIASVLLAKGYLPEEIANKQVAAQAWKRFGCNERRATRKALAEALIHA